MDSEPARGEGVWALFELAEQMVGFPFFTIEAPAGTVVELMVQESHSEDNPPGSTPTSTAGRASCAARA